MPIIYKMSLLFTYCYNHIYNFADLLVESLDNQVYLSHYLDIQTCTRIIVYLEKLFFNDMNLVE